MRAFRWRHSLASDLQCLSAYPWGWLSDRIGRKTVIQLGTIATTLSLVGLGSARSYWIAIVVRFLGGLLNGIIGALKTCIAESFDEAGQTQARAAISCLLITHVLKQRHMLPIISHQDASTRW